MSNPNVDQIKEIMARLSHNKSALMALKTVIEPVINDRLTNENGKTLLIWAAKSGHELVVEVLLEFGAFVDKQDSDQNTALSWAVYRGHEEIADQLFKVKADVNKSDSQYNTPLHWAVYDKFYSLFEKLLAHGARTDLKNKNNQTASDYICKWDNSEEKTKFLTLLDKNASKISEKTEPVESVKAVPVETKTKVEKINTSNHTTYMKSLAEEIDDNIEDDSEDDSDDEDSDDERVVDSLTNEQFVQVAKLIKSFNVRFSIKNGEMKI